MPGGRRVRRLVPGGALASAWASPPSWAEYQARCPVNDCFPETSIDLLLDSEHSRQREYMGLVMTGESRFISVVVSIRDAEAWLEKVLFGYLLQTFRNFELIIADDGSGSEAQKLISGFEMRAPFPVRHFRHRGRGCRRYEIINKAILHAGYDYLVLTDGDCIPRRDFLEVHASNARRGRFLSGGCCRLGVDTSWKIGPEEIASGACFNPDWLKRQGRVGLSSRVKLGAGRRAAGFLDAVKPTGATFNGCNASAWKEDLLSVNGYDERMEYGGADREIGERLFNLGIKGIHMGHRAVCLHLDDSRSCKSMDSLGENRAIRSETRRLKRVWTPWGVDRVRPGSAVREAGTLRSDPDREVTAVEGS